MKDEISPIFDTERVNVDACCGRPHPEGVFSSGNERRSLVRHGPILKKPLGILGVIEDYQPGFI